MVVLVAQQAQQPELTSGRPIPPEEACYDVQKYNLTVRVDPATKSIQGEVEVEFLLLKDSDDIELDLDSRLTVSSVTTGWTVIDEQDNGPAQFTHVNGVLRIHAPETFRRHLNHPRTAFDVTVRYAGQP